MDKFSIINSAKMISEARGDEADAILICRINDGESQISIIGLNKDKRESDSDGRIARYADQRRSEHGIQAQRVVL